VQRGSGVLKTTPLPPKRDAEEAGRGTRGAKGKAKAPANRGAQEEEEGGEKQLRKSLGELLGPGDVIRVGANDEDQEAVRGGRAVCVVGRGGGRNGVLGWKGLWCFQISAGVCVCLEGVTWVCVMFWT
jgi:hypothetical protein